MSSRTSRTDRPSLLAWIQSLIASSVVELVRPRRRRRLTTVGGRLETRDRPVPPAEEMRGQVLEAPLTHRSRLGHPVDADLVDEIRQACTLALAAGDDLRTVVDVERLRRARTPSRPSRRRRGRASRVHSALRGAELVQQRGDDPRPARADRVAERDRAAVDVDLVPVEAELATVGQHLRGERLVDLDQVERLDRHLDPVEQPADALDRGEEEPLRRDLGLGVADDPGERLEARAARRRARSRRRSPPRRR